MATDSTLTVQENLGDPSASPPAPTTVVRLFRLAKRFLLLTGLILLGFFAALYAFQASLIFPGSSSQGKPESVVRAGVGEELVKLPTPGGQVVALFSPAQDPDGMPLADAASRPALVFFYGNAMCLAYSSLELDRFRRLGLNVIIPDYLGYGMSGGKPSEVGCRQTAEACYEFLRSRGFPAERIVVGGWSLGGAVAIDLASRRTVGGLFAFSTFTSVRGMSRTFFPLPPPAFLFIDKFDSLSKIPKLTCPILLGHGRRDPLVPFRMFERLAAAAKSPPARLVIDQAEHNDFLDLAGRRMDQAILDLAAKTDR
ncbi:alpha/beta hydrolase [Paludisphaera mucosa]|uniref:Alpha/beta hydrolase n=1 Tax=Paludisphaera mucosa TaxID=3030827 RepID=A0ABT6F6Y9_9BACT|nr:alpha/beta hydrolase [Paludisphaera mucosa]MDG3003360.1 alpha/beta hydrolase [Paludisphaera mucosa]